MLSVLKIALVVLLVAFGLWIYEHEYENALPVSSDLDVWFGILGGVLLVIFLIVTIFGKIFGKTSKWRRKYRCVRCGAKIRKNEMYCTKHKGDIASEYLRGRNPENPNR